MKTKFDVENLKDRLYFQSIDGAGFEEGDNLTFVNSLYFKMGTAKLANLQYVDDDIIESLKKGLLEKGKEKFEVPEGKNLVGLCGFDLRVYDTEISGMTMPNEASADVYAILE